MLEICLCFHLISSGAATCPALEVEKCWVVPPENRSAVMGEHAVPGTGFWNKRYLSCDLGRACRS